MIPQAFDLVVLGGGIVGLWTATQAERAGAAVAVVEVGTAKRSAQRAPKPALRFPLRENVGAVRARNHVLGGNSSYWGGGLVRNSHVALAEMYGAAIAADIRREFDNVERALGVAPGFAPAALKLGGRALHEVAVLPGKRRGLWSTSGRGSRIRYFTEAEIVGLTCALGGTVERIMIRTGDGQEHGLAPKDVALCMGIVDSNLFAQRWLVDNVPAGIRPILGSRLHDHWSVPLSTVTWRNGSAASTLFPPKVASGVIVGRRMTLDHGFFHVVADFDTMPPYDRVKNFLRVRQEGGRAPALVSAAMQTLVSPWGMIRAGVHYVSEHELYVPDGSHVRLVLDFESSRHSANRIRSSGDHATLDWDMRDDDFERFDAIVRRHREWWESVWESAHIRASWLFDDWSPESLRQHLVRAATDALHLGGGLHADYAGEAGPAEANGRLKGCPNLFVNGTAFFCRPGPGNPVLTLLSRANVYVQGLANGDRAR